MALGIMRPQSQDAAFKSISLSIKPRVGLVPGAFFISTTGNDSTGDGSLGNPWLTIGKFNSVAVAGNTCYMRGGTYLFATQNVVDASGSSGSYITLRNYPGETPVIDGTGNNNSGGYAGIRVAGNYWYFKGLEIYNSPGHGFYTVAGVHHLTIEMCNVHDCMRVDVAGGSLQLNTSGDILILNNDVHHTGHTGSEGGTGIALDSATGVSNNVIRGNRMWRNNDNGLATFNCFSPVLIENNWCWENGYDVNGVHQDPGDGVGFKLGGNQTGDGGHTVRNNLLWGNYGNGYDDNSADNPITVYNNTAYGNALDGISNNFAFYTNIANVLRNNLATTPRAAFSSPGNVVHDHNSWDLSVTVTDADFLSVDFTANTGARKADGSLPDSNFLRLAGGSDCIDAGTDVGIAYNGAAPDLGAYET